MQFEIIYLLRLEWSSLISFLQDIYDQKSNFVEKDDISLYKIFLLKDGHYKTWEDENHWPASKTRFRGMILLKTVTSSSNNGYFPLKATYMSRDLSEALNLL